MTVGKSWLVCLSLWAACAGAEDLSPTYKVCMDRSEGVTLNMLECFGAETKRHDLRLNQNFQAALQTLESEQQKGLREAQRAWIGFRDAQCGFIDNLTGGSIDRINAADCMLEMTKTRADALEDLVKLYLDN